MSDVVEVKGATLPDGTEVRFKDEVARNIVGEVVVTPITNAELLEICKI